jgi:hypothetical protein
VMNWRFLYETVAFRGPERRDPTGTAGSGVRDEDSSEKIRLR